MINDGLRAPLSHPNAALEGCAGDGGCWFGFTGEEGIIFRCWIDRQLHLLIDWLIETMHQDQLEELLTRAVELYRAVPTFSELYMSRTDAMVAMGIPFVDANSDRLQQQMHRMVTGFQQ